MSLHDVDRPWIAAILRQLTETVCVLDERTQSVEFKANFNFASLSVYARTMAALANTSGGYILFGISDDPREVVGLANERLSSIDPSRLSAELNKALEPALIWRHGVLHVEGKLLGYFHVEEAKNKPIVSRRTEGDLREGAIYYRYPGMTQEVRYPELMGIIEEIKRRTDERWTSLISRVASVGINNAGVLDLTSGKVTGSGGALFIPPELLPELQFIREGEFVEAAGAPALKLIGEAQVASIAAVQSNEDGNTQIIQVPTHLSGPDIMRAFLNQEHVADPKQWLLAILAQQSGFFPVHFFRKQARMYKRELVNFLEQSLIRSQGRSKLLSRVKQGTKFTRSVITGPSETGILRGQLLTRLKSRSLSGDDKAKAMDRILEAILHVNQKNCDLNYVLQLLLGLLPTYPTMNSFQAGRFRTAISFLDEAWFSEED